MNPRPRTGPVSPLLVKRIESALAEVDDSRSRLSAVVADGAPYLQRRQAYARVSLAFETADRLLREVTRAARPGPYHVWRQWRHRLSQLDMAKQIHMFAQNDAQVLGLGSVRAIDTGMLGPAVGDYLHGECSPHGTPARYGIDLDAALAAVPVRAATSAAAGTREEIRAETAATVPATAPTPAGAAAA